MTRAKLGTLLIASIAALAVASAPRRADAKVFDVTGHWTGSSTSAKDGSMSTLAADLQANKKGSGFTGTLEVVDPGGTEDFKVRGKVGAGNKTLTMALTLKGHSPASITGKLNTTVPEVTGKYRATGKHADHGTFTLTR